jgi:hypothetical protein
VLASLFWPSATGCVSLGGGGVEFTIIFGYFTIILTKFFLQNALFNACFFVDKQNKKVIFDSTPPCVMLKPL